MWSSEIMQSKCCHISVNVQVLWNPSMKRVLISPCTIMYPVTGMLSTSSQDSVLSDKDIYRCDLVNLKLKSVCVKRSHWRTIYYIVCWAAHNNLRSACEKKYFKTKGYKSLVFFSFHEPRPSLTGILIWTMASINNVGLK